MLTGAWSRRAPGRRGHSPGAPAGADGHAPLRAPPAPAGHHGPPERHRWVTPRPGGCTPPGTCPSAHPGHSRVPPALCRVPCPPSLWEPPGFGVLGGHSSVPPIRAHPCHAGHRGAPRGTRAVPAPVIPARPTAPFPMFAAPGILPLCGETEARLLSPSWHGSHVALYATGGGSPRPPAVPAVPGVGTAVVTARAVPALSQLPLAPGQSRPVIIPLGTPATSGRAHVPPEGTRGTRGLRRGN